MQNIAIIGAGLSGTLLAMNLLKQNCRQRVHIRLIDRNSEQDLGPAYSTNEDYLLNVPAGIMGAFSRDPEHFLKWAASSYGDVGQGDYLPRKLYRKYIQTVFNQSLSEKEQNITFERICGEVTDLQMKGKQARLVIRNHDDITADRIVLALGNSPPGYPASKNKSFIGHGSYAHNPWNPDILNHVSPEDCIFFIGTGQTMVDLLTGLYRRKHRGRLVGISRRGLMPMSQKQVAPYPSFYEELKLHTRLLPVYQIVRKHMEIASRKGLDPRAVIDSLRPHTSAIWMNFPPEEKRRFLRHVFRYWEIIRSRIPPASERIVNELRKNNQLEILAGSIMDITPDDKKLTICYRDRFSEEMKSESADLVINCMGPNLDYDRIDQPLIRNLIRNKLIQPDPVHLGINALPDGSILTVDGTPSNILFTVGLTLKGIVWEALATPEIRVQAENLARRLVTEELN